jgi:hypothetical protein
MNFLYLAYTVTWVIHIVYLGILLRRYSQLRKDADDLNKK